jgi:hypothetical protein
MPRLLAVFRARPSPFLEIANMAAGMTSIEATASPYAQTLQGK